MSKIGNQSKNISTQYYSHNNKIANKIQISKIPPDKEEFNEFEIDSDFYEDFNPSSPYKNQISNRSFKEQGNKMKNIKYESNSRKTYTTNISNQAKKEFNKIKHSNLKNEVDRQKELYKSPDIKSSSLFDSPLFNKDNGNSRDIEEIGYKSNYVYESKKINGKNIGTYSTNEKYEYINKNGKKESKYEKSSMGSPSGIEMISPVGYMENNSSGSEMDENQIKSMENYQYSVKTTNTNKTNYNKYNKLKRKEKEKNFELEEPEGFDYLSKNKKEVNNDKIKTSSRFMNRSQIKKVEDSYTYTSEIKDFQSPERNPTQSTKFRNVNMKMIDSKGPTNEDEKVNNIMVKEIIDKRKYKDEKQYEIGTFVKKKKQNSYYSNDTKIRNEAAKIIQAWWRKKNYREEEVYDITVKSAIKLQSFIRGFLVRKKVLRYITLAIYYQSFCDKLQDVLCNYIKKIIFKLFKEKFLLIQKTRKISRNYEYQRKQLLLNILEKAIEKEYYYILKILEKWKEIAYKLKTKEKQKEMLKYKMKKTKTDSNFNKSLNKSNSNISSSQNMYIKEVKVTTVRKSTQKPQPQPFNSYQTKTNKLVKSTYLDSSKKSECFSPRTSTINISQKIKSPIINSKLATEVKKKKIYSPYPRDNSTEKKYKINVNQSYNINKYKKEKEKIQYTTIDNRSNHQSFTRVDKSKEKERKISPQFGTLRKTDTNYKQKTYNTNKSQKTLDIKRKTDNTNKNIINKIYTKIDTSKTNSTKIVKNIVKKVEINKQKYNINSNLNRSYKNVIKSKPSNKLNNITSYKSSYDTKIYSQGRPKRSFSTRKYKTSTEYHRHYNNNTIDNHLSVSIIKFPDENDQLNKSTEDAIQKIRLKEKIIYEKEMPAETAEEAVGFQIFEMKISKRVSLFIEPSTELRQKIIDEKKELEVFKKRERERSKEIDKYKKDIELHKLKNLLDALRRAIRITESFKRRILQKKFYQYRNNCSDKPLILEIDPMDDWAITNKPKEKRDFSIQATPPQEKKIRNFKVLKITKMYPINFIRKKIEKPQRITRSKLNILSKSKKKDQGQQSDSWNTEISPLKNYNINILNSKKERDINYYKYNLEGEGWEYQILKNKPKMVDEAAQHEYEENIIQNNGFALFRDKPKYKDTYSQYEKDKPKVSGQKKFSIINKIKEKKIETKEAQCNTLIETVEEGINAVEKTEPKIKNVEVQIRTVKRSLVKMEIPILKKLWLRKAFRTFRDNCRRPPFHLILERELLRMAFLRWRFIRGYGPDRYGNAYDRDGNLLYRVKGKVADFETQNEEVTEQDERGTQYIQVENVISKRKQIQISPSYKKQAKKEMKDQSVGNNIKMVERIQKRESFNINQKKKKEPNRISNKNNFVILKKQKQLKDKETQILKVDNEIDKMDDFKVIDDQGFLKKKKTTRKKELLTQILYKREIHRKLTLSEALRNWLKQAILLMHNEEIEYENYKRRQTKINKSDRFTLIENKRKQEAFTQMPIVKNKIETATNINLTKSIQKKNAQISVNFPSQFDVEKIRPKKENKIVYESTKKPLVLKTNKETNMNIYGKDYLFKEEIKRGIRHQMTEEARKRVMEILYKFIITKGDVFSLLRKYFTIWNRKSNYLSLIYNARVISEFCKRNLNKLLNYRNWRKISQKLVLREKIQLIKLSKEITYRINKIFDLIRITRVNSIFSKKKYIHFIIIAWLAYTRNIKNKRTNVKNLYENMINTYMTMAEDVFGKNQKENPSVQDALFEAVDSNKFSTNKMQDVPLAKEYYGKKTSITRITKNISTYSSYETKENKDMNKYKAPKKTDNNIVIYTSYNLKTQPVQNKTSINVNNNTNINKKNIYEGNRYNILNKYKTNKYKPNIETSERSYKSYQNINTNKNEDSFNSNRKGTTYKIQYTREQRTERSESKGKERSESKGKERSESKGKERSESKGKERSESKGSQSKYRNRKEEKEKLESKGKNMYKSEKEEKERFSFRGNNISTFISKREEKSDYSKIKEKTYKLEKNIIERKYVNKFDKETVESKKKNKKEDSFEGRKSLRSEKEERSESKGRVLSKRSEKNERSESKGRVLSSRNEKGERSESRGRGASNRSQKNERSESKGSGASNRNEKGERSESRGRGASNRSEKSERSESKGKRYTYMSEEDFDPYADYNNHNYFESKKYVIKRENKGGVETKNIMTIKKINIKEDENEDKTNKYKISNEIDINKYDNMDKNEKRKLSYGERRKLFRQKFVKNQKKEDN